MKFAVFVAGACASSIAGAQVSVLTAAPGVFKVTPSGDLPPGQYGFVISMSAGTGMVARIFDLSVS